MRIKEIIHINFKLLYDYTDMLSSEASNEEDLYMSDSEMREILLYVTIVE